MNAASPKSCLPLPGLHKAGLGIRSFASKRIITAYNDLPKSYTDERGLDFRERPLTKQETSAIFGKHIGNSDVNTANRLTKIMHGRRVAGTLQDPNLTLKKSERVAAEKALQWLRANVAVDEVDCAGRRALDELALIEDEKAIEDYTRLGLYKPNSGNQKVKDGEKPPSVYGESGLDFIRKRNEDKWEAEQEEKRKLKEIEDKKLARQAAEVQKMSGDVQPASSQTLVEAPSARLQYYLDRAQVSNSPEAPEMTLTKRLGPSLLFTLYILAVALIFPSFYTPPKNADRMFPMLPPAAATVLTIIGANAFIFLCWKFPPFWRLGNMYFITTPGAPRYQSLLLNTFSHQTLSHLTTNMVMLFFIGTKLHDEVGRANFLSIYFASGIFGSFASMATFVFRGVLVSSSLGASGAVSGVIGAYLWLRKNDVVTFWGLLDPETSFLRVTYWGALLAWLSADIYFLTRLNKSPIVADHVAHLAGAFVGLSYAEYLKRSKVATARREVERREKLGVAGRIKEGIITK